MATGIDAVAHNTAIQKGGKTIAVLPCGLKNIFPKENLNLYKKILEFGGTIITEYAEEEKADSNKFLERNRIVSGLSIAILVVEAAYRSGTSVTAKLAKSQNRDVFCIPGSLDNPKSVGTNELIKDFAKMVTEPKDIIKNYPFLHRRKVKKKDLKKMHEVEDMPEAYRNIYQIITETPIDSNDIVKLTHMSLKDIMPKLTILELEGKIKKVAGNRYKRRWGLINKKELGNIGEEISCYYLQKIGYDILERNFTCRQGEIDIIAKDEEEYVFIEVKTRTSLCYGRPIEAVNTDKQKHIYKSTSYYLYTKQLEHSFTRFDIIEVFLDKQKYKLKHWKGVDINFNQ